MLDNKIVNQVVSALLNQNGGSKTLSKLYGTVEIVDGKKYVKLDGSDTLTAIVEGTEVMAGDRVLVSIENHQAVVISNITSPASARTATSFMEFINDELIDGLVIGEIAGTDGNPPQSVVIGTIKEEGVDDEDQSHGVYLRVGDNIIAKFIGDNYSYSKVEFGPFSAIGSSDKYEAILDSLGLNIYRNRGEGYDIYDAAIRVQAGYVFVDDGSYTTEIANGKVISENGCNAKIVYVDKTISDLSIPATDNADFTTSVTVPSGYTPCGLLAYQLNMHKNTCCFTKVDLDLDGTIKFNIQNHGNTAWTNEQAYFQVACIWTG